MIKKFVLIAIFAFFISAQTFCAEINFKTGFISDNAGIIRDIHSTVINNVLHNLRQDTGCDVVVVTINSLKKVSLDDIEKQIFSRYMLGGENKDKWVILVFTRVPSKVHVMVGDGLTQAIPKSMTRGLGVEYNMMGFMGTNISTSIYTTTLYTAEAVADSEDSRIRYSQDNRTIQNYIVRLPESSDTAKFIRRHNLIPAILIVILGLFIYGALNRNRHFIFLRRG